MQKTFQHHILHHSVSFPALWKFHCPSHPFLSSYSDIFSIVGCSSQFLLLLNIWDFFTVVLYISYIWGRSFSFCPFDSFQSAYSPDYHITTNCMILFYHMAECYSVVYMCHSFLNSVICSLTFGLFLDFNYSE